MHNKIRGSLIEDYVVELLKQHGDVQSGFSEYYDATFNGIPIEVKSSELIIRERKGKVIGSRCGYFHMQKDAAQIFQQHLIAYYCFVVVVKKKPVFVCFVPHLKVMIRKNIPMRIIYEGLSLQDFVEKHKREA